MCATQYSPNMHWHAGLIWEVLAVSDPLCATVDGVSEPASTGKKGSKAKAAAQNGTTDFPEYDGECWAFSSRYMKSTQAALQLAYDAIQVPCTLALLDAKLACMHALHAAHCVLLGPIYLTACTQ